MQMNSGRRPGLVGCLILVVALAATVANASPSAILASMPVAIAEGVVSAGSGGVKVCPAPAGEKAPRAIRFDSGSDSFVLSSIGTTTRLNLSQNEFREMADAVLQAKDDCVEVSFDPVLDQKEEFTGPALQSAPTIASTLLKMDSGIGNILLEGEFEAPNGAMGNAPLPANEARRLLDARAAVSADADQYRKLARATSTPPISWHHTTITVSPVDQQLTVHVDPTAMVLSPDDRRIHLSGEDARVAALPYRPLIERFEGQPEAFASAVPGLEDGLRYARAWGVLRSCAGTPSCRNELQQLRYELGPAAGTSNSLASLLQQLQETRQNSDRQLFGQGVKQARLRLEWRRYRFSLNTAALPREVRLAMYIDETIGNYRSLQTAGLVALEDRPTPERLQALVSGIDMKAAGLEWEGWVHLCNAIVGVWTGASLDAIDQEFAHAMDTARGSRPDLGLEGLVLRASADLLPVMRSNLYVETRSGGKIGLVGGRYSPLAGHVSTGPVGPLTWLDRLANDVTLALPERQTRALAALDREVKALSAEGVGLKADEALQVLSHFYQYHLTTADDDEMNVTERLAAIQMHIGLAYMQAGEHDPAHDWGRILLATAKSVDPTEKSDPKTERSLLAARIRHFASLLRDF